MTHSVHTAHGIMLQDTEGEHHGQLVLSPMPQTGTQTLSPTVTSLPGKVQTCTLFKELFFGGEEALLKANRMNVLCCPFVAAL